MADAVNGLVCAGVGCLLIVLNKPFARYYVRLQRRLLGFDLGRRGIGRGRVIVAFTGTTLLLLGILLLSFPSLGGF